MIRFTNNGLIRALIVLCLMLFAVDFLGMGWYILGVTFLLSLLYLFATQKTLVLDGLFFWVALLAISNFLIMYINSNADIVTKIIKYLMAPIMGYLIGSILASETKRADDIFKLYMYVVIPFFIHGVLNLLIFDGIDLSNREIADFWTGIMWKATLACTYFAMTVPLVFLSFVTKGFTKKVMYFALTAVSVYASIITASRTVIYVGIIVLAIELLLYFSSDRKAEQSARKTKVFLKVLAAVAVVAVVVVANLDTLSSTDFFRRMFQSDVSEEPRIRLFMNVILNTIDYPFGNMPYFYSHNTWLDFLRESGWITFFCFFVITVIAVRNLICVYKNTSISHTKRIAVVGMMMALLLEMFVEPMMDGAPIMFCMFFYLIGVNNRFIYKVDGGVNHV